MELYPGWSARDNYGYGSKKKKRKKDRSPADSGGIIHCFVLFILFWFLFRKKNKKKRFFLVFLLKKLSPKAVGRFFFLVYDYNLVKLFILSFEKNDEKIFFWMQNSYKNNHDSRN